MNNSVFGKTMENVRERSKIVVVSGFEVGRLLKLIAKPNFRGAHTFENSELVSVNVGSSKVTLHKPIFLGQALLDVSKTLMYGFHYEYVKPKYGNRARLLFTDTDSLFYITQTEDFYKDIAGDVPKWFDTSDYPEKHPTRLPRMNKKILGMMKDEASGKTIAEFAGLRSKLYSFRMYDGKASKKCKGVKKALTFENYRDCLFNGTTYQAKFNVLRSRKHNVTTECVTKVALSAKDDKRYVISNDPEHRTLVRFTTERFSRCTFRKFSTKSLRKFRRTFSRKS